MYLLPVSRIMQYRAQGSIHVFFSNFMYVQSHSNILRDICVDVVKLIRE